MDTNEWELSVDVEPPLAPLPVEIAALAAQLRAGRCVLCVGPRLGEGGLGLRDVVAQFFGELLDDDVK